MTLRDALPVLVTPRLELRHLGAVEPEVLLDFYTRNKEHLAPTNPTLPSDFFTRAFWRRMAEIARAELDDDRAVRFVLLPRQVGAGTGPRPMIGAANFTQIVRGPLQAGNLGYAMDRDAQAQGLMTEALREAIRYMFEVHNLHRIQANHLPENTASARVLAKLGFDVEGYARDYLHIAGQWRDHVLNALSNPAWRPPESHP